MAQLLFVLVLVTLFNSSFQQAGRIRLVGGSGPHEGRVEVRRYTSSYYWGTVCDDSFDMSDARVVCRMLGYTGASAVHDSAYYGQGSGNIYMDGLMCTGIESSLFDCSYNGWGVHDCSHSEDVGVVCYTSFGTTPTPTPTPTPDKGCSTVRISGSTSYQSDRMTTYTMTGQTRGGRPVYKSSRGDYLFYYLSDGSWHVGPYLGSATVGMYVDDTSINAEDITGTWYLYDGSTTFRPNSGIRVSCDVGLSTGAIVGIVVGVVAAVVLIIVICYCCCCKKSAPVATTAENSQPVGTTNPSFQPTPSGPPPAYSPPTQPQPDGLVFVRVVRIQ
uniref:SRCR domain-containing protein n=1 Tax=Branchiostoma floridae TaxID=7739 RepID=C3XYG1_BRAFL|eukprot:XP_002610836.1 hypothetical protein BRAFLDRAFT_94923 [Branchiostoma floridae]